MKISDEDFYNPSLFSIMSMGFCYPGKGRSGDLPPRFECALLWHAEIMTHFQPQLLVLLIGQYAQRYYLGSNRRNTLSETVKHFKSFLPLYFPLPHPSPRNFNWIKSNPWFLNDVLPELRKEVKVRLHL